MNDFIKKINAYNELQKRKARRKKIGYILVACELIFTGLILFIG